MSPTLGGTPESLLTRRRCAPVAHEGVAVVRVARGLDPHRRLDGRKPDVTGRRLLDLGDLQPGEPRPGSPVELSSAADEDRLRSERERLVERLIQGCDDLDAIAAPQPVPG